MVSDSHNYRKNEIAARKIEMELQLNPFIPSPPETRPGNRQAIMNASRRATRKGTLDPSKINAQAVRDALGQARDRAHFEKLLVDVGLQAEFDRRGQAQEIYGWRLRRQGAAEWFKASTVAKDLSWPKIAHHFIEADFPEPIQAAPLAAPTAAPEQRFPVRSDRMPEAVKFILAPRFSASGLPVAVPGQHKSAFDLEKMERLEAGPLSTTMLVLGGALVNFSMELAHKIISFMRRVLAKFGLDMRPVVRQESGLQSLPGLDYEPVAPAKSNEALVVMSNAAADDIMKLVDAVNKKDPSLLPQAEGREKVVAAMVEEFGSAAGAEVQPADALTPMQSAAVFPPELTLRSNGTSVQTAAHPDIPLTPEKTSWIAFEATANQFKAAHTAVQRAREKDIFYIDSRPAIKRELVHVQAGLVELEAEFSAWREAHKVASAFASDPLRFRPKLLSQKMEIERLESQHRAAEKKHVEFEKVWNSTPEPVVPVALMGHQNALISRLRENCIALLSEAKNDLKILAQNPFLKSEHQALTAKIRRIEDRFDPFLLRPLKSFLTDFQATLQEVATEISVEKARFAPPDHLPEEAAADAPRQK